LSRHCVEVGEGVVRVVFARWWHILEQVTILIPGLEADIEHCSIAREVDVRASLETTTDRCVVSPAHQRNSTVVQRPLIITRHSKLPTVAGSARRIVVTSFSGQSNCQRFRCVSHSPCVRTRPLRCNILQLAIHPSKIEQIRVEINAAAEGPQLIAVVHAFIQRGRMPHLQEVLASPKPRTTSDLVLPP
jgi:hypothetical protein